MTGTTITGWAGALPDRILTNADFERMLDTSDAWITERTGIKERHVGGATSQLATQASLAALTRAGRVPADVDVFVLSTTTPDQTVPATSSAVHEAMGLRCPAFDLNAACAGFVYAVVVAHSMLTARGSCAVVAGADVLSKITDYDDRSTAVLFGDGAGAIVMERTDGDDALLAWDLGVDGSARELLYCDHGGYLRMNGQEVFRRAVRVSVASAQAVLDKAGIPPDKIALYVPHQANLRIMDAVAERLGLDRSRTAVVLDRTGNTSSASIPLALADAADAGRLADGDIVLLSGFGAGMTWASALLRWGRG